MQLSQFPQFEIIILHLLKQQDFSGEHIYQILNKHFQIIEGDILISLFFLIITKCFFVVLAKLLKIHVMDIFIQLTHDSGL